MYEDFITFLSASVTIVMVLSLIGKTGAAGAFSCIILLTAELFPTPLRNTIIGSSSFFDRLGGLASPYLADLVDMLSFYTFKYQDLQSVLIYNCDNDAGFFDHCIKYHITSSVKYMITNHND